MPRQKNPNKPKRDFLGGYKTYEPEVEGYGDSAQWRQAFRWRMGIDAAKAKVGKKSPLAILGIETVLPYTMEAWKTIKTAYRKMAFATHPDYNPGDPTAEERFKNIQAAYELLEDEYQRHGVDAR